MTPRPQTALNPGEWLRREYLKRARARPQYSLRDFAEALGLSSGRLSEIISGKRRLTIKAAKDLVDRLGYDVATRERFLALVGAQPRLRVRAEETARDHSFRALSGDESDVVAEWHHFAILSLLETEDFSSDAVWIARRLGLSPAVVCDAVESLLRVGAVERRDDRLVVTGNMMTTDGIPSAALRSSHRRTLEQTIAALDSVPVEMRDVVSISMAIDTSRLPEARQAAREFGRRMMELLETGSRDEVYNLNIQLVPVTRR